MALTTSTVACAHVEEPFVGPMDKGHFFGPCIRTFVSAILRHRPVDLTCSDVRD